MTTRTFHSVVSHVRDRRATVAQRRRLAAELADFRTDAERLELESMLERVDEHDAAYVRSLLSATR